MYKKRQSQYDYTLIRLIATEIVDHEYTVRDVTKVMCEQYGIPVSKSAVHHHMTTTLAKVDRDLYRRVKDILQYNLSMRHIRGGESTGRKYTLRKKQGRK